MDKNLEDLVKKVESNAEKIHKNTGALEILKTFKEDSRRFY